MSKNEQLNTVDEPIVDDVTYAADEVLAKVIRLEDGFHVVDFDGTVGPVCTRRTTDGYVILTPNKSNRKCINEKNATKYFDENPDGFIPLYYKATRVMGSCGPKMPNAKLISYLSEEDQEEYKAIIARAIAARDADKKKPMTELEKAKARAEKAKAAYEKLLAQAAEM